MFLPHETRHLPGAEHGDGGRPRGRVKSRLRALAARHVRFWMDGPGVVHPDDPRQRVVRTGPAWGTFKVLETVEGDGSPVRVGRYSIIHYTSTMVAGGLHHSDWVGLMHAHLEDGRWIKNRDGVYSNGPITIGSDAWVGFEAVLMSGVTIGDGAIVGARAVVTKSVEPYSIVVGNPARHVRYRFDEPIRQALLRIRWWDWTDERVSAHAQQIDSPDVAGFVERHDPRRGEPTCPLCS